MISASAKYGRSLSAFSYAQGGIAKSGCHPKKYA
jgi:hypothetical protein